MTYTIGQLGRLTGTKVPTIRYYEGVGLLDPVGRTEGGQRRCDEPARQRLRFIRRARDLGRYPQASTAARASASNRVAHSTLLRSSPTAT